MAQNESRRHSIVEAMVRVAGRVGYREATVGKTIVAAGVSRTTFYKHFGGKLDCFLAAYDLSTERALGAVAAGCDRERPWPQGVRGGLESLLALLAAEPEPARVAVVEATAAGAPARSRQWATIARAAVLLESGRGGVERRGAKLPANTGLMATAGVAGLLFDEIQAGRAAELPQRLPELLFALLVPYLGPQEAAEEARREAAYPAASR